MFCVGGNTVVLLDDRVEHIFEDLNRKGFKIVINFTLETEDYLKFIVALLK